MTWNGVMAVILRYAKVLDFDAKGFIISVYDYADIHRDYGERVR